MQEDLNELNKKIAELIGEFQTKYPNNYSYDLKCHFFENINDNTYKIDGVALRVKTTSNWRITKK
jgi:hypothetical protein